MNMTQITESGDNSILRWAISNAAELKDNIPLASIINDDLFYLVTISGVNFYELFRLTQLYRNKIRICNINRTSIPSNELVTECFPGYEAAVIESLSTFSAMVTQMMADSDIISDGAAKLFLPMLTMTFDIQIPFAFIDVLDVITEDEARRLFNVDYPNTLTEIYQSDNTHSLKRAILILVEKNTSNLRYDRKYEQLLKMTKYGMLQNRSDRLFKVGLVSFSKFDSMVRGEVRCSMFKPNPEVIQSKMKRLGSLRSPLELTIAVQLPLYYQQMLEASYFPEDLRITHRSSVTNIIDNGLVFDDFITSEEDEDHINAVNNYKVRITEANLRVLNLIQTMTSNTQGQLIHPQSMIALLPSIYQSNCLITLNHEDISHFLNHSDPILSDLFEEVNRIGNMIQTDLQR